MRKRNATFHRRRQNAFTFQRGRNQAIGIGNELMFFHRPRQLFNDRRRRRALQIRHHQFFRAKPRNARLRFVTIHLRHIARGIRFIRKQNAPTARARHQMLCQANLLGLRNWNLHSARRTTPIRHPRHHNVALLIKPRVNPRHLRFQLLLQAINGFIQRIQMRAVPRLMMFIARKHKLL